MSKKFSIIIPAYNEEKYLLEALCSVESQTFDLSQLEVVVVDNASTDKTSAVFESFFSSNSIDSLLLKEPQLGAGRAKNKGAAEAQGEIFLFLDADSRLSPQTVEKVYEAYKLEFLLGTIRLKADSSDWTANFFFDLIHFGKKIFNIMANMGFCHRELFFEAGGFNPDLKQAEDLEFYRRAKKILKKKRKNWCLIEETPIFTSARRLEHFPLKLGYLLTLLEWGLGGFLGLQRRSYIPYR